MIDESNKDVAMLFYLWFEDGGDECVLIETSLSWIRIT
jgi:hypothetical protein